jgi:hypothetical protein
MAVLNIRKVDEELAHQIRMEACAAGVDVRVWVIEQLAKACGMAGRHMAPARKRQSNKRMPATVATPPSLPPEAHEETNGGLQQLTSAGLPRCQQHDSSGWQCRLAEGHGNNCM